MAVAGLEGKVAIVTGAAQGLGRCHAEALAAHGAAVVLSDVSDDVDATVEAIVAAGGTASSHRGSASDWDAAGSLVAQAIETYGDVDVVVANAGITRDAMSFSMTEDQFDSVIDVHLKGHFAPVHFAAAHWRQAAKSLAEGEPARGRRIITTTSESGLFGGPAQANYGAAKGGIITMTLVLARELGKYGVTANCIAPRARTKMTEGIPLFAPPDDQGEGAETFDRYDPAHVSPMVAWLASDAAGDVSGQVFIVTGDQLHRIAPTAIAASVANDGKRWTLDEITARRADFFGDSDPGVPTWAGPPM